MPAVNIIALESAAVTPMAGPRVAYGNVVAASTDNRNAAMGSLEAPVAVNISNPELAVRVTSYATIPTLSNSA